MYGGVTDDYDEIELLEHFIQVLHRDHPDWNATDCLKVARAKLQLNQILEEAEMNKHGSSLSQTSGAKSPKGRAQSAGGGGKTRPGKDVGGSV
jgi:hypothetical protein